ncbi:MAG: hypothetical protein U5K77_00985 [Candidatus Saccharibacteria bacterium]|nr:hypothetical protein [Candidatus Saccharibacteria bacterium]
MTSDISEGLALNVQGRTSLNGSVNVKADSTSSFTVQNAAGNSTLLNANTSSMSLSVGSAETTDARLYVAAEMTSTAWVPYTGIPADWSDVAYGNSTFVAVAHDGTNRVMTSSDGETWTAHAAAEANSWRSVTYGNGTFVAVADDGTNRVMTSSDGETWTAHAAAEANSWRSVTYGNGTFVAVACRWHQPRYDKLRRRNLDRSRRRRS